MNVTYNGKEVATSHVKQPYNHETGFAIVSKESEFSKVVKLFGNAGEVTVLKDTYELIELDWKDEFVYNDNLWVVADIAHSEKVTCFCYASCSVHEVNIEKIVQKVIKKK